MYNPIPSIFGIEYDDGFKKNREWATPSLRRHIELVNVLGYAPLLIDIASNVLGKDVVEDSHNFLKRNF